MSIPIPQVPTPDLGISVQEEAGGFSIHLPPGGFTGSALIAMIVGGALLFAAMTTPFVALLMWSKGEVMIAALMMLATVVEIGAGIFLLRAGLRMARADTLIDVLDGTLLITRDGLRGVAQDCWPIDEISSVHVGDSTIMVNDRAIPELKIIVGGKTIGRLVGRNPDMLHWLAQSLHACAVEKTASVPDASSIA